MDYHVQFWCNSFTFANCIKNLAETLDGVGFAMPRNGFNSADRIASSKRELRTLDPCRGTRCSLHNQTRSGFDSASGIGCNSATCVTHALKPSCFHHKRRSDSCIWTIVWDLVTIFVVFWFVPVVTVVFDLDFDFPFLFPTTPVDCLSYGFSRR